MTVIKINAYFKVKHGDKGAEVRHVGDLGNVVVEGNSVTIDITDSYPNLYNFPTVVGRAIVIHGGEDDLGQGGDAGSEASGNAGPRLQCCTIKMKNEDKDC